MKEFILKLQLQINTVNPPSKCLVMIDEQLFSHIGWSIQTKSALPNSTPPTYNNLDIFLNQSKKYCQEQDHLFIQTQLKNIKPTASELNHISEACSRLWNLDDLRMEPVKQGNFLFILLLVGVVWLFLFLSIFSPFCFFLSIFFFFFYLH